MQVRRSNAHEESRDRLHERLPQVLSILIDHTTHDIGASATRGSMSLNSVVNNLVRAAASIPVDISDADLDRHVAALLAEEAKAREVKWSELGLGAWTGSTGRDSCVPL